jgi:hypothetical protein
MIKMYSISRFSNCIAKFIYRKHLPAPSANAAGLTSSGLANFAKNSRTILSFSLSPLRSIAANHPL